MCVCTKWAGAEASASPDRPVKTPRHMRGGRKDSCCCAEMELSTLAFPFEEEAEDRAQWCSKPWSKTGY